MLYLQYSRDWKRNADAAIREICDGAASDPRKRILIVPEQNSFDAEMALCRAGGDTISRHAEVLSFTRMATRVFSQVGGAAISTMDKSGRLIAMAGALEQLRPRLKLYGRHVTKPEFLQQLLQVVDEFHGYGLRAEDVRRAKERLSQPLSEKLEELCLILESFDAVCAGALQDASTRLDRLRDAIYDSDYGRMAHIVVEGFTDFTNQELEVLEALMQKADRMTVYLTCDRLDAGQTVFSVPRKTTAALRECARRQQVLFRPSPLLGPEEETELGHLSRRIFSPTLTAWEGETQRIQLCHGRSVEEECDAMLTRLQTLLLSGARYRDVAIAYTDPGRYRPILENLLDRSRIPAYYSGASEILSQPVIRCVLYALEAAACGMDARSLSEYLKSGYAPVDPDQADRLENYGFVWRLKGSRWEAPFDRHPAGFQKDDHTDPEALQQLLAPLNLARERAIGPISVLKRGLSEAKNTADQVDALDAFLKAVELNRQLTEKTEALEAALQLQQAQALSQLYAILLGTMEQIYGVLGKTVRTPEDFYRLFRAALTQNTVGTVPSTLDRVRVGQLSAMRNVRVRHLLLLGAEDGYLPAYETSAGLISDAERRMMSVAGLQVAPEDSERMDRELLTAYTVLTAPEETLFLGCGGENPSYLFTRIAELFPRRRPVPTAPLPATERQLTALLANLPEAAREKAVSQLPEQAAPVSALLTRAAYSPGTLDRNAVRALYGEHLGLDASRVEKFASCKYAYYLRYGLSVREQKEARVDASLFGVFVHYVLESTVRTVQQEGGFRAVSLERTLELAEESCEAFVKKQLNDLEAYSERGAYLFRRNFREVRQIVRDLYAEMRQSEFVPVSFELAFKDSTAIPVTGDLAAGSLRGFVDRVDLYTTAAGKTYLRVVDYKTGQKDFDYTEILEGLGLQMLIYLFALTREAERFYGRPLEPAGVLYLPAKYDVQSLKGRPDPEEAEKVHRKTLKRKGLLLEDEEILRAMEPDTVTPVFLPYHYVKKDKARTGDLADAERLRQMERHVNRVLGRLADEIWQGRIEPNPFWRNEAHNACKWCEYREVCHIDSGEISLRRRKRVSREAFWEALEKEDGDNG